MASRMADKHKEGAMKVLDLTGQRFERLFVIKQVGVSKDGQKTYLCRCDCGNEKIIKSGSLRSGGTKSCGCYNADRIRKRNKRNSKHGGCGSRLYGIWMDMRTRCRFKKSINWHLYGGRGIKVCNEWQNDFSAFRDWALLNGYEDGLQIDRIDNDGNYEPDNCKWSTVSEQGNNRRTCVYITIDEETKTLTEWCKITGVSRSTAYNRIYKGWEPKRAVTEKTKPVKKLSQEDVRYIKNSYIARDKEYGGKALAKKYNVSISTIEKILAGDNWKGVR